MAERIMYRVRLEPGATVQVKDGSSVAEVRVISMLNALAAMEDANPLLFRRLVRSSHNGQVLSNLDVSQLRRHLHMYFRAGELNREAFQLVKLCVPHPDDMRIQNPICYE